MAIHLSFSRHVRRLATLAAVLAGIAIALPHHAAANALLFDFGAPETQTIPTPDGETTYWNNLPGSVGSDDFGAVYDLVTVEGEITGLVLQMITRFNGVNEAGTPDSTLFPATATQDSLFGNTEEFGGLENIYPSFVIGGLDPSRRYTLTFYASRLGAADNRETRYTVIGAAETIVDLDAANNIDTVAVASNLTPDGSGLLTISLSPGPNNNNANHFTYLGVLGIESDTGTRWLVDFGSNGRLTEIQEPSAPDAWNNITTEIGSMDGGGLAELVTTNGVPTTMALQIVSRFNSVNPDGTTASDVFPATATRDSLYGNIESFNGLENILPSFKLIGLRTDYSYDFTFFASRAGVTDRRDTRYTVTGANTKSAELDASNNTNATATVVGVIPDAAGEITISLEPGAANNNANHFIYLGAMRVDYNPVRTPRILIDFGAGGTPTTPADDPDNAWNNVTTTVGNTDDGRLDNLVKTDGTSTPIGLQMVARFNGANENGTTLSDLFPVTATRDSLYGNTEIWGEFENVFPVFKLTNLRPDTAYDLTFYASRMGAGDNRETLYTITGAEEIVLSYNPANNELETARAEGVRPNAAGEIQIGLTPGPNNDNGNHFTYIGVLQVDWEADETGEEPAPPTLGAPALAAGTFSFHIAGTPGATYRIERSSDLTTWTEATSVTLDTDSATVEIEAPADSQFYRAIAE